MSLEGLGSGGNERVARPEHEIMAQRGYCPLWGLGMYHITEVVGEFMRVLLSVQ
jgi:hypothetical protein